MKFVAVVDGKQVRFEVTKTNGGYCLTMDGKSLSVDAIRPAHHLFSLLVEGKSYEVAVEKRDNDFSVSFYDDTVEFALYEARRFKALELTKRSGPAGPLKITAPMPGKIVKVAVTENSQVDQGQALLIIEAMKMQNELKAPRSGIVKNLNAREGEAVSSQQVLLVLE
jgi:biotin carboxyl carrier protein